jgi:flagellar biosynthesis/type III secretory pathway M-ring protein FliF/YscJ
VRLFCTIYNRETGRYEFDDARVLQIVAAAIFVLAVVFFLVREVLLSRRQAGR